MSLSNRLQEIYKTQNLGYLYLFFSTKSFSELVDNSFYYGRIISKDITDIQNISSSLDNLKQKRLQLNQQKQAIENLRANFKQQHTDYLHKAQTKQSMYTNLRAQRQEYEKNIAELLRNSKEMEDMIQRLMLSGPSGAHGTGKFMWPLKGQITSYYGYRRHPIFRIIRFHTGVDIASRIGRPIPAADTGIVIYSGWWGGYGLATIVDHGQGFTTVYGHQSKSYVRKGDHVTKGQTIGLIGSTGYSTGPHLHFEIRINGKTVNPMKYF